MNIKFASKCVNTGVSRRQFVKAAGAMTATALFAPSIARAAMSGEIVVETFGGSYADAVRDYIVKPFEAKYGVKVRLGSFGNNEEQLAKLQAGNSRVDVSSLNGDGVYVAIKGNALQQLRLDNIANFKDQDPKFVKPAYEVGDGNNYSAALVWGDQAIAYNTQMIKQAPDSWEALWNEAYKGRVSAYGANPGPIYMAATALGQDMTNITDLGAIDAKLAALKPNLLKWWSSGSELSQLFASGDVWISDFWRGRVNNLKKDGVPVDYVVPKEGAPSWVDVMVIPKSCENREAAEAFINTMLDPEVQRNFCTKGITYAPSNIKTHLTKDEQIFLGATPEIFAGAKFPNAPYQAANIDKWNTIVNRLKA